MFGKLSHKSRGRGNMVYLRFFMLAVVLLGGLTGCWGRGVSPMEMAAHMAPPPGPPPSEQAALTPEQRVIAEALKQNGLRGQNPTVILVRKKSRRLTTYRGLAAIKTYPIVLGSNSTADKMCQGDRCTPEGVYRVVDKYPHPKWTYFILLDYPNAFNWAKFDRAKKAGRLPPNAEIGGAIGIHGTEDDYRNMRGENWTLGCISLMNRHVEEIYPLVNPGTLVVIQRD